MPTLADLPDSQGWVTDWVCACHEVYPDDEDIPTIGRAIQWLDNADTSSGRVRAVISHIRHSDIQTATAGVSRDASEHGSALSVSPVLGQITELTDTIDCEKIARCAPYPGASLIMWSHVDDADRIAFTLSGGGSETIRMENASVDMVIE